MPLYSVSEPVALAANGGHLRESKSGLLTPFVQREQKCYVFFTYLANYSATSAKIKQ